MQTKLRLSIGESLRPVSHHNKGPLAETDTYSYEIVNETGQVIGFVEHTDHTSLNGLHRSQHVIQKDLEGTVMVDERW